MFSDEGQKQIHQVIGHYKQNAKVIADALKELGRLAYWRRAFSLYLASVSQRYGLLGFLLICC